MLNKRFVSTKPVIDKDIEWYCAIHKILVKHTGKDDWAHCPKCGTYIHAVHKKLHQVTTYKTAFCNAKVAVDDISKDGYARCSKCNSPAEPVFEDTVDVEEVEL